MNEITIHNLDENVLLRLKQWAWQRGMSLEDSVRLLLVDAMCFGRFETGVRKSALDQTQGHRPDIPR